MIVKIVDNNHPKSLVFLGLILTGLFMIALPKATLAEATISEIQGQVRLDAATISKGYTLENYTKSVRLGIFPDAVNEPIQVVFKQKNSLLQSIKLPDNLRLISDLYEFDIQASNQLEFIKPLVLQLSYQTENNYSKKVYYYDTRRFDWYEMPAWDYQVESFVRSYFHLAYAIVAVFEELPEKKSLLIDQETISRGYTVTTANVEVSIGITPGSINVPTTVNIKPEPEEADFPTEVKRISNVYSFDLLANETIQLSRAIYLKLVYTEDNGGTKEIRYWDGNKNSWVALPSSVDKDTETVRAAIMLPYAKIAVFEDTRFIKEGVASYFTTKDPQGCAYLDHEKGDWLRVTDLESGKSIEVFIEDRGPYIEGRVIDLSRESFAELAPLSRGLLRVRVQKIDK